MEKSNQEKNVLWYDSGNTVTSIIIGIILLIIICSQSFAVGGNSSLALFGSIINYNTVYLLALIYFILIKTHFGKKYFNYLNVFLIFIYLIVMITSLLTVIQSFSLNTILSFILNLVIVIYLFHTMFRDTRIWKDFKLGESPFNELSNEWYFYALIVLSVFSLVVNLISTVVISGVVLSILDCLYVVFLGRYIFLYGEFLNEKKKDIHNSGNFDEIRENIKDVADDVSDKINDLIEESNLDEKIDVMKDKIVEVSKNVTDVVTDFVEETTNHDKVVKGDKSNSDTGDKEKEVTKKKKTSNSTSQTHKRLKKDTKEKKGDSK